MPPAGNDRRTPPPFPLVAPTRASNPPAPVPQGAPENEALEPEDADAEKPASAGRGKRLILTGAAAVVVLGGFMAWQHFSAPPPPKAIVAKPAPKPATPKATAPAKTTGTTPAPATPSDTLNAIAHAPVNAINKAQDAIAARRASGQTRVDAAALGEDAPAKPATTPATAPHQATTMTTVAPGLTASTAVEAAAEASPAFRSFVANAKVSGVFQGSPARAFINGRLLRVGETVDAGLGIVFDGLDAAKRNLIFKDKTGASVARKY